MPHLVDHRRIRPRAVPGRSYKSLMSRSALEGDAPIGIESATKRHPIKHKEPDHVTAASRDAGHRPFSKRRIVLLASAAGLGAGMLFAGYAWTPNSTGSALFAPPLAHAQNAQRPVGFADIVEKVKPSVISVKVKMNAGGDSLTLNEDNPLRGTPFEDFFRRFVSPTTHRASGRLTPTSGVRDHNGARHHGPRLRILHLG
jgi:hypothetical protein